MKILDSLRIARRLCSRRNRQLGSFLDLCFPLRPRKMVSLQRQRRFDPFVRREKKFDFLSSFSDRNKLERSFSDGDWRSNFDERFGNGSNSERLFVDVQKSRRKIFISKSEKTKKFCFSRKIFFFLHRKDFQQNELPTELQRILDEDILLLQQQIETVKLEQLFNELKFSNEQIEKQTTPHKVLSLPFFSGVNPASGSSEFFTKLENLEEKQFSFSRFEKKIQNWSNR